MNLDGKVAIVTGGAGLLGSRFCVALEDAGATAISVDSHGEMGHPYNITSPSAVRSLVQFFTGQHGPPDILINAACVEPPGFLDPHDDYTLETWREVMAVNLDGTFLMCQAVSKVMERGSIINMASIYGMVGPQPSIYEGSEYEDKPLALPPSYPASKGGILALTRYLAVALAPGIRVNALSPGGVLNGHNSEFKARYSERTPLGRMAYPKEIVGPMLFLAGDDSTYVTGHNLVVDGGWTAW